LWRPSAREDNRSPAGDRKAIQVKKLVVVLMALGLIGAIGAPADARNRGLACGDVVTSDVRLQRSLTGCTTGLVIGAPGVTVDLNGHAIEGVGRETAGAGIEAADVSGVTVRNGRISGFGTGVLLQGVTASRVAALTIADTVSGIRVFDPELTPATRNVIAGNRISSSRNGVTVFGSVVVAGNAVSDISADGAPWSETSPIGVGIYCRASAGSSTLVIANAVERAEHVGIDFFFCWGDIVGNDASENGRWGIHKEGSNGLVAVNRVTRNAAGGIVSSDSHGLFAGNVANSNGGDGIRVHDQFADHGPFHTLTGNIANANAGFGIATSLSGVVDGGGNRARANGEAAQCLGIVCNR
jgi:hypothetical protein